MASMVKQVTGRSGQPSDFPHDVVFLPGEKEAFVDSLVNLCSGFPWEQMVHFGSGVAGEAIVTHRASGPVQPSRRPSRPPPKAAVAPPPPKPAPAPKPAPPITRPGCTAADNAGVVLYHLEGLSKEGKPNFGVLRVSKERLEEGATAAASLGRQDLAQQMREIASKLPQIHDAAAATSLAAELRPVAYAAWDLGAQCKGSLSPEQMGKARILARQVQEGKLSMDQAIKQVQEK